MNGVFRAGMNDNDFNLPGHSPVVLNANRNLKASNSLDLIATDLRRFPEVTNVAAEIASVANLTAVRRQELKARSGRRVE
ncbi:hypothetical protein HYPP_02804 [Hyphomicrobium sp. ghe19]|nr:hypothetical protein HYPP_02804 [Hyphomicrobium sp. ghe19]